LQGSILGILLFIFNLVDIVSTSYLIALYGVDVEMNPLVKVMVGYMGMWWVVPKLFIGILASFVVMVTWGKVPRAKYVIVPIVIIYSLLFIYHLVLWNYMT
jgi:hypothetical protein